MHKSLLAALVLAAAASPSLATLTFFDPFNYPNPDGATTSLSGNTDLSFSPNQTWFIGAGAANGGTNDPKTNPGNLSYPGLPASTGNSVLLNNTLAGQTVSRVDISKFSEPTGATPVNIYYSMLLKVTDLTGLTSTTTGSFLTGLQYNYPEAATPTSDGMTSATAIAAGTINIHASGTGGYNLGIAVRDQPAAATRVFDTTSYGTSDTLFVVVKYVLGSGNKDDAAYLYINPDSSTFGHTEPASFTKASISAGMPSEYDYFYLNTDGTRQVDSGGVPLTSFRSLILRNNSVEPAHIQLDELRVGTTWADVTSSPIPGDANDDGVVNRDDYALIDRGFLAAIPAGKTHYSDGDFNFDGAVNQADYLIIDQAFLAGGGDPSGLVSARQAQFGDAYVSSLMASVPEPASLAALAVPALALTRLRRRR